MKLRTPVTTIMTYNLVKTAAAGKLIANEEAEAPALTKEVVVHKEKLKKATNRDKSLVTRFHYAVDFRFQELLHNCKLV